MASGPSLSSIVHRLREISKASVKVGLLQNAGSAPDGTPLTEIGAVHEFGTRDGHIPQRSWLRATFRRTDAQRKAFTSNLIKKVLSDQSMSVDRALGLLGAWAVARVQETIVRRLTEGPENQALKPATIAAKGSSTPLVDTGQLKNAIAFQVVTK
jgi:hypothetical protein